MRATPDPLKFLRHCFWSARGRRHHHHFWTCLGRRRHCFSRCHVGATPLQTKSSVVLVADKAELEDPKLRMALAISLLRSKFFVQNPPPNPSASDTDVLRWKRKVYFFRNRSYFYSLCPVWLVRKFRKIENIHLLLFIDTGFDLRSLKYILSTADISSFFRFFFSLQFAPICWGWQSLIELLQWWRYRQRSASKRFWDSEKISNWPKVISLLFSLSLRFFIVIILLFFKFV